ncbi:MAG: DUF1801 domain-containing protein [Planctomycetaceae bacterium]|nr:DUF1801 domain-containing protein [Planctomycetaceae bacterium]
MGTKDPRVDAYIAKAAPFARPILERLRKVVHTGCPTVEEDIKWGAPFFMYQGVLCSMAAFKQHCSFGFWKGTLLKSLAARGTAHEAMGQLGRIESLADLPSDEFLAAQVKEAMRLAHRPIMGARIRRESDVPPETHGATQPAHRSRVGRQI